MWRARCLAGADSGSGDVKSGPGGGVGGGEALSRNPNYSIKPRENT